MTSLIDQIRGRWSRNGVSDALTFLEEVGSASAENVLSAALKRWILRDPQTASRWIADTTGRPFSARAIHCEREVSLSPDSRIDLVVGHNGNREVYIENKWVAAPSDKQLFRYRQAIDASTPGAPLVVMSPVHHVWNQGVTPVANVILESWATLPSIMQKHVQAGSVEDDLRQTLTRWRDVGDTVREAIRNHGTRVSDVTQIVAWFTTAFDVKYASILKRLIVAELGEAFCASSVPHSWRRCDTGHGPHHDTYANLAPAAFHDGWYPCGGTQGLGVSVSMCFDAPAAFDSFGVGLGSAIRPYPVGRTARDRLLSKWPDECARAFILAADVRRQLHDVLKGAGIRPCGNPSAQQWWKRANQRIVVSGDSSMESLLDEGAKLGEAVTRGGRLNIVCN